MLSAAQLWPLWLLAIVPLIALAGRRRMSSHARPLMTPASALRALTLALLTSALMRPSIEYAARDVSVVYALDVSRSVSRESIAAALDWIRAAAARNPGAASSYVAFGAFPLRADDIATLASLAQGGAEAEPIDSGATDLEQALDAARAGLRRDAVQRLVLLSDGNQTQGDVWRAAARLRQQHVRVFSIPATVAVQDEAWLEGCDAPQSAHALESVRIGVHVFARRRIRARIELRVPGQPLQSRDVTLLPGSNAMPFTTRFRDVGTHVVAARLVSENVRVAQADTLMQSIWVRPRTRALYIEGAPPSASYLSSALRAQGIDATITDVLALERDPALLDHYDAVILSDLPAASLSTGAVGRLEGFVREGGGLIFSAGDAVHGQDGYAGTAIERLLPVKFEDRRERRELDLVLLVDRSASMQGPKLEFAKSAALSALELLAAHHRYAVIAFDSQPHDVVPLAAARDRRDAELAIRRVAAGGQTDIFNALQHAHELLGRSRAQTKHVILLSDGDTRPVARERAPLPGDRSAPTAGRHAARDFPELIALLARDHVTLSTLALGEQPEIAFLRSLALGTGGRSYVAATEAEIPALLVRDTQRLLGASIVEEPFQPRLRASAAVLAGIDFARAPALLGYAIAHAKPSAEALLEAPERRPLLAQAHYGLGRTVAFLSDAKNRWARAWLEWPGYARLWAQIVRSAGRPDSTGGLVLRVERADRDARVVLTARTPDGRHRDGLAVRIRVLDPYGRTSIEPLVQAAPGEYVARIALVPSTRAPYRFELAEGGDVSPREASKLGSRGVFFPGGDELRARAPNLGMLHALSDATGGRFDASIDDVFADYGDHGLRRIELWPYLALTALAVFIAEVAARRHAWRRIRPLLLPAYYVIGRKPSDPARE